MKKLFISFIVVLSVLSAALTFTACKSKGGDDDGDGGVSALDSGFPAWTATPAATAGALQTALLEDGYDVQLFTAATFPASVKDGRFIAKNKFAVNNLDNVVVAVKDDKGYAALYFKRDADADTIYTAYVNGSIETAQTESEEVSGVTIKTARVVSKTRTYFIRIAKNVVYLSDVEKIEVTDDGSQNLDDRIANAASYFPAWTQSLTTAKKDAEKLEEEGFEVTYMYVSEALALADGAFEIPPEMSGLFAGYEQLIILIASDGDKAWAIIYGNELPAYSLTGITFNSLTVSMIMPELAKNEYIQEYCDIGLVNLDTMFISDKEATYTAYIQKRAAASDKIIVAADTDTLKSLADLILSSAEEVPIAETVPAIEYAENENLPAWTTAIPATPEALVALLAEDNVTARVTTIEEAMEATGLGMGTMLINGESFSEYYHIGECVIDDESLVVIYFENANYAYSYFQYLDTGIKAMTDNAFLKAEYEAVDDGSFEFTLSGTKMIVRYNGVSVAVIGIPAE